MIDVSIEPNAYFQAKATETDAPYHHLFDFEPPPIFGFREDAGPPMGAEGLDRLIGYYARMRDGRPQGGGAADLWAPLIEGHAVLTEPLEARNHARLAAVLQDMGATPLVTGLATHIPASTLRVDQRGRDWEAMMLTDKLISLNEVRQLTQVLNPEQGGWILTDLDIPRMTARGFSLATRQIPPPAAGGSLFGVTSPLGVYTSRDVLSFYAALRVEAILRQCRRNFGVVEIGGGLGFLAYYSQRMHPKRWRIYDLPTVSVLQAYILMRSLGEDAVRLWGEGGGGGPGTELGPYWLLYDYDEPTSLFINQDSLPEINRPDAERYIDTIVRARPEYFLSINQEARASDGFGGSQLVVSALALPKQELARKQRSRDWLRKGWVEELYAHRNPRLS